MDRSVVSLELRLIKEKVSRRMQAATLVGSAWDPKTVELPPGERFLVVSPHPDDDVIGCGGTIIKARARGKAVRICYLSLPARDAPSPEARMAETEGALRLMGVTDFSIRREEFPATVDAVAEHLSQEIERFGPDCVLVPSPLENQDQHLMAFEGHVKALSALKSEAATALYEVWNPLIPNMLVDVTAQMEAKLQGIAAHASQVKVVDYVRLAKGLSEYRAAMATLPGSVEAFLYLEKKDLLRMFGR